MPDLSERVDLPELMDTTTFPEPVVRKTLSFLGMTARRFGGAAIVKDKLQRWIPPADKKPYTILDVGSGGAEIPISLAAWSRSRGVSLRITALDLMPEIAAVARDNAARWPEVEVRCADVFDLARSGERFDFVTASLFLHHIPSSRIVDILRLFDSLALRGLVISDLARTPLSYWSVSALARLAGNHVVRHDAPLSVRRSFLAGELRDFATQAGLSYLNVETEPWFRLSLSGRKP